ncbi:MAG: hypothetical protein OES26_07840 [Gammaproteobacteria bacterium]|nr:hypothetical protein [Gammaproteobacteria bacterium]
MFARIITNIRQDRNMLKLILAPSRLWWPVSMVLAAVIPLALGAEPTSTEPVAAISNQKAPLESSVGSAAGVAAKRVYVDPQSGRLLSSPPPGVPVLALSAKERQMISRSHAGLYEEVLPNGAIMMNLQGRFRNFAVASVGDTTRHMSCVGDSAVIDPTVAKPEDSPGVADE